MQALLLIVLNGAPSQDAAVLSGLAIVTTLLAATGIRSMQSVANPKGPNGGYGHFIRQCFIIAISLFALAACVGAAIESDQATSRNTPGWFTAIRAGILGLVIGAGFIGALVQPSSSDVATLTYTNGVPTVHVGLSNFDLPSATIAKGSQLLLAADTTEQHVIANGTWQNTTPLAAREAGAPLLNNLLLSGNSVAIGPFDVAGTYPFTAQSTGA